MLVGFKVNLLTCMILSLVYCHLTKLNGVKTIHFVLPHSYFIAFCRDYAYYDMYNSYLCNKTTILARQIDQMGLIMDQIGLKMVQKVLKVDQ